MHIASTQGSVEPDLAAIQADLSSLLVLAFQLGERVKAAIEPPRPLTKAERRAIAREYLASAQQAEVRELLLDARGERGAANLHTRMGKALASRGSRRALMTQNGHSSDHAEIGA